jgi:hypothetical protein
MRDTNRFALIILLLASTLGGCHVEWVREHPLGCRSDETALIEDRLYFGFALPQGGEVSAAEWNRFEDDVLSPAFPKGYTVIDARGHWRGAGGPLAESSRVVVVVHAWGDAANQAIDGVIARYRSRFHQDSVLREHSNVCVRF